MFCLCFASHNKVSGANHVIAIFRQKNNKPTTPIAVLLHICFHATAHRCRVCLPQI